MVQTHVTIWCIEPYASIHRKAAYTIFEPCLTQKYGNILFRDVFRYTMRKNAYCIRLTRIL